MTRWALLCAVVALAAAGAAPAEAALPRVPILTYHGVGSSPRFESQMDALDRAGYEAVTLGRVYQAWRGEAGLPRRPVVLTFDDGYASQYETALPALRARGWRGVLFLVVGRLGREGGLTAGQVREMVAARWDLGAHTLSHPDLRTVGPARLREEVAGSAAAIERRFGLRPAFFAYPFGRAGAREEDAVRRAGFLAAATMRRALAAPGGDRYALPRIGVSTRLAPGAVLARIRRAG